MYIHIYILPINNIINKTTNSVALMIYVSNIIGMARTPNYKNLFKCTNQEKNLRSLIIIMVDL